MQKTEDNKLILAKEEYEAITSKAYFEGALVMLNKMEKVMDDNMRALSNGLKRQFDTIRARLDIGDKNDNITK